MHCRSNFFVVSTSLLWCLFVVSFFPAKSYGEEETRNLLAFGDSLTEACYIDGDSECGWVGTYSNGYESELESLLNAHPWNERWDIRVFNYGKGGEQTYEGVGRLADVLDNYTCDKPVKFILLMEGTNDLLHHKNIGQIEYNLELMIGISRGHGLEILLATIPPDPESPYKNILGLNEAIRRIAEEQAAKYGDVTLVDQYSALAPDWVSYTTPKGCYNDLTHPNDSGFDAMAAVWYESLPDFMKQPPPLPGLMLLFDSVLVQQEEDVIQ